MRLTWIAERLESARRGKVSAQTPNEESWWAGYGTAMHEAWDEEMAGDATPSPATLFRYVLKTPMGESFSEPTKTHLKPSEVLKVLGDADQYLHRIEYNDGNGWITL